MAPVRKWLIAVHKLCVNAGANLPSLLSSRQLWIALRLTGFATSMSSAGATVRIRGSNRLAGKGVLRTL